jgi:hypothetical protein
MNLISFDISTHTGWAFFKDGVLTDYGLLEVKVEDLGFKPDPTKSPKYPKNILVAAESMSSQMMDIIHKYQPDRVVAENTVRGGGNRTTQRVLEFIHKDFLDSLFSSELFMSGACTFRYIDPSEWRSKLGVRLSKDDKKNNRLVSQGKKRGRVTPKHLSVARVNEEFGLDLKIKNNDISDSILVGLSDLKG